MTDAKGCSVPCEPRQPRQPRLTGSWRSGPQLVRAEEVRASAVAARELAGTVTAATAVTAAFAFTGARLLAVRHALEDIAGRIAGDIDHETPRRRGTTRWAGIGHALYELVANRADGYSLPSMSDPDVLERRTGALGISYPHHGPDRASRAADDLVEVRAALAAAYVDTTTTALSLTGCRMSCVMRYVAGATPREIAAELHVDAREIGRVSRAGAARIYDYLSSRELIPVRDGREEGDEMDAITDADLVGWSEIAAYLHCSTRTARTWSRECGLPVMRFRGRVEARSDDLRAWRQEQTERVAVDE